MSKVISRTNFNSSKFNAKGFQGWWRIATSFAGNFNQSGVISDSFIYIDTSEDPFVTIVDWGGTPDLPHALVIGYEIDEAPAPNYFIQSPNELVEVIDFNDPFPEIFTRYQGSTLLLVDSDTISASRRGSQAQYEADGFVVSVIFKRVAFPAPTVLPSIQNDPIFLAKYIISHWKWYFNRQVNKHYKDPDFVGKKHAKRIIQKFFSTGFSKTTPIRRIRASTKFPNPHGFIDKLTDLYTGQDDLGIFSFATPGSTVIIKGFEDEFKCFNGTYVNGIAVLEAGAIPNARPKAIDSGPNGSFHNLYNHVLLNLDTSQFPRSPKTGLIKFKGCPTITVTHKFCPQMQYAEFNAAISALFYAIYRNSTHNHSAVYTPEKSLLPYNTWNDLKSAFANNSYFITLDFYRINQAGPSFFYQNGPLMFSDNFTFFVRAFTTTLYNDPHGINVNVGSKWDYNTVLCNYLINPKVLYWGIQGTLEFDQVDPLLLGYPALIPSTSRAHFISVLGDVNIVNGRPVPINPDPNKYRILTSTAGNTPTEQQSANAYYFGQIDEKFTNGKKVGYLRWFDTSPADDLAFMYSGVFSPEDPNTSNNPRIARESVSEVYATMMEYLVQMVKIDSLIIDIRGNGGGQVVSFIALAEFFGEQRTGFKAYDDFVPKLDYPIVPIKSLPSVNDYFLETNKATASTVYINLNKKKYPNAVWSRKGKKRIIILDDIFAISGGDALPHFFLGDKQDGHIGNNTQTKIIGDIIGTLKGGASPEQKMPLPTDNIEFKSPSGKPISTYLYGFDSPLTSWKLPNGKFIFQQVAVPNKAPTLKGTSGKAPLPNTWKTTVWLDIGAITPHPDSRLPGDNRGAPNINEQSTWRDRWLEQAIRKAIKS